MIGRSRTYSEGSDPESPLYSIATSRDLKFSTRQSARLLKKDGARDRARESIDEGYFVSYCDPAIHAEMVGDKVRMEAYDKAIKLVCPGKVVADIGAGSGVLTLASAAAGAAHTYGIEASDFI